MSHADLEPLVRRCHDSPEEAEAWVALARWCARHEQPPPPLAFVQVPPLVAAWAAEPGEPALGQILLPLAGLQPAGPSPDPPFWYADPGELASDSRGAYHRPTGLPLWVSRGGERLVLVPALGLEGSRSRSTWTTLPGYLREDLYPCFLAPSVSDAPMAARVLEEGLVSACGEHGLELPLPPPSGTAGLPLSRLFGRHLAHGLTPEDCLPLPPPALRPQVLVRPEVRLGGAPVQPFHQPQGLLERLKRWITGD